jgi:integrase
LLDFKVKTYELKKTGHTVVSYIDPTNLKRKRRKFSSKTEAKNYLKELELLFSTKGPEAFNETPVSQLMEHYLKQEPNSRILERKNHFLSFCDEFGHRPINQIGKNELLVWFRKIKEKDDLSDRTLSTIKSNTNAFFKFLVDEGILSTSPLLKIQFERRPPARRPRVVLSVDEVKSVLEAAKASSPQVLYPFLFAAAYTGARRSEILKLKRADVDFNIGLIHFRRTKNGEDRSIRIPKSLQTFLKEHLQSHDSELAFPDPEGKRMGTQRLCRAIRRVKKHFPMGKNWGPHSLRHSYAYNYLKQGGQMYQLQAILGHKSIDVTVDIYGQIGAQDIENPCPYETDIQK